MVSQSRLRRLSAPDLFRGETRGDFSTAEIAEELRRRKDAGTEIQSTGRIVQVRAPKPLTSRQRSAERRRDRSQEAAEVRRLRSVSSRAPGATARAQRQFDTTKPERKPRKTTTARTKLEPVARRKKPDAKASTERKPDQGRETRVFSRFRQSEANRLQAILDRKKAAREKPTVSKLTESKRVPGDPGEKRVKITSAVRGPDAPIGQGEGRGTDLAQALRSGRTKAQLLADRFKESDIDDAVKRNAANKALEVRKLIRAEGVDLEKAIKEGVKVKTLIDAGFTQSDIDAATKRNSATQILRDKGLINASGGVDTNKALAEGVKARTLLDAGFTTGQLARAKIDAKLAAQKAKPRDLVAEIRDKKIAPQDLIAEGFARKDVKEAQLKIFADRQLEKFETKDGVDIDAALQRGVPLSTLRQAGFTPEDITQAQIAKRAFDKSNTTTGLLKRAGVKVAEAVVPGVWVKDWNRLSNKERAFNIAFDAMFIIPVAGATVRAARGLKTAAKLTRGQKAAQGSLNRIRSKQPQAVTKSLGTGTSQAPVSEVQKIVARIDHENAVRVNLSRVDAQKKTLSETFKGIEKERLAATRTERLTKEAETQSRLNRINVEREQVKSALKDAAAAGKQAKRAGMREARAHIAARDAAGAGRSLARQLSRDAAEQVKRLDLESTRLTRLNELDANRKATEALIKGAGETGKKADREVLRLARGEIVARDGKTSKSALKEIIKERPGLADQVASAVKRIDAETLKTANLTKVNAQRDSLAKGLKEAGFASKMGKIDDIQEAQAFIKNRDLGASASNLPSAVQKAIARLDREAATKARLTEINTNRASTNELLKEATKARQRSSALATREAREHIRLRDASRGTEAGKTALSRRLSSETTEAVKRMDREARVKARLNILNIRRASVEELLKGTAKTARVEKAQNLGEARAFIAERDAILKPVQATGLARRTIDAQITRGANEISLLVRQTGSSRQVLQSRDAALKLGLALEQRNAAALRSAARELSDIGRTLNLPVLVNRMRPLLSQGGSQKALRSLDTAGKTALKEGRASVDDVNRQLFKIDDASELRKASDKGTRETQRLKDDITRTEKLRNRTKSPERKEKLKERIERTKTQVKEREKTVDLTFEKPLFPPVAGSVPARRGATTTALAQRVKKTTALARSAKAKKDTRLSARKAPGAAAAAAGSRLGTAVSEGPKVAAKTKSRSAVFVAPRTSAETVLVSAVATGAALEAKTAPKTKATPFPKPSPATQPQPLRVAKPSPVATPKPSPVAQPKPSPAPAKQPTPKPVDKVVPKPTPKTKPVLRQPAPTPARTATKPPPSRKIARKFRLPGGDRTPPLRPGTFPRIVTWRQGFARVKLDIDTGEKKFTRTKEQTPLTPAQSFRVVTTDNTRPKSQSFRQGVVQINVRPHSISFKGLKRRSRRGID